MPSAIVVGGGVAGLVFGRDLLAAGWSVTIIEAGDRLGGKVARHTLADIPLDAGAESFANRRGTVAGLAAELGLTVVAPRSEGAWLKPAVGNPMPLPATSFLGIPGTPLASDVIGVVGLPGALRAQMDGLMLGQVAAKEKTLGRMVRRRMGNAVLERLVAPIVTGIHSKHPDELEVDVVAPGLRAALLRTGSLAHAVRSLREASPAGSAVSGIDGGIQRIVERLELDFERRGGKVLFDSRVEAADAASVTLADGTRLTADHVALATPLDAPAEATIALATLVVDAPELDSAPRGTGLLVAAGTPDIGAKALTHATAKWPWLAASVPEHRHVVRLSYSAATATREQALTDAQALLGVRLPDTAVLGFDVVAWPAVPPPPTPVEGVILVGESVAGTGLAAVIAHARRAAAALVTNS
jgi:oxygen-dependent protoporphyrinogen oxidase